MNSANSLDTLLIGTSNATIVGSVTGNTLTPSSICLGGSWNEPQEYIKEAYEAQKCLFWNTRKEHEVQVGNEVNQYFQKYLPFEMRFLRLLLLELSYDGLIITHPSKTFLDKAQEYLSNHSHNFDYDKGLRAMSFGSPKISDHYYLRESFRLHLGFEHLKGEIGREFLPLEGLYPGLQELHRILEEYLTRDLTALVEEYFGSGLFWILHPERKPKSEVKVVNFGWSGYQVQGIN